MSVMIGQPAPDFSAKAAAGQTVQKLTLSELKGNKVVLFFYPLDFTFVCPTELVAFQAKLADFKARNVEVIAVSTDSHFSHMAWLRTPRADGGIEGVTYPIVADITKSISREYGVLLEDEGIALRGLFLIDEQGIVKHITINDNSLGRNVDEVLRMVDALAFHQKHGEVCPANWTPGQKAINKTKAADYFQNVMAKTA